MIPNKTVIWQFFRISELWSLMFFSYFAVYLAALSVMPGKTVIWQCFRISELWSLVFFSCFAVC